MKYLILFLTVVTLAIVSYIGYDRFKTKNDLYTHHAIVYQELQDIKSIAIENNKGIKANGNKLDLILNIATNNPYYNDR